MSVDSKFSAGNIAIHWRQFINRNRNNSPFLSGDTFSNLVDVSFFDKRELKAPQNLDKIARARTIFCPSHLYENMLVDFGNRIQAEILVLGNSDRDFSSPLKGLPKSVSAVYLQNSLYFDNMHRLLPIGIENLKLGMNGQKSLYAAKYFYAKKHNQLLVGPFSLTHPEREPLINLDQNKSKFIKSFTGRISPKKYAEISSSYKYVACPRGNGLDTHRFWESLYRGCYPVVIKSRWSNELIRLGIPLVEIENWGLEQMEELQNLKLNDFNPKDIEFLWADRWEKEFKF